MKNRYQSCVFYSLGHLSPFQLNSNFIYKKSNKSPTNELHFFFVNRAHMITPVDTKIGLEFDSGQISEGI